MYVKKIASKPFQYYNWKKNLEVISELDILGINIEDYREQV